MRWIRRLARCVIASIVLVAAAPAGSGGQAAALVGAAAPDLRCEATYVGSVNDGEDWYYYECEDGSYGWIMIRMA